jgi:hypothetical protein
MFRDMKRNQRRKQKKIANKEYKMLEGCISLQEKFKINFKEDGVNNWLNATDG